jgi:hypothetical protein
VTKAPFGRNSLPSVRRRLDAIAGAVIAFMDSIDGDEDLEETSEDEGAQCEDEGAQCDDEGSQDDNGLGDTDGAAEQGWRSVYGGYVK